MARSADGPWFRKSKNTWYAKIKGQQVSLKTKDAKEAQTVWHRLMGGLTVDASPKPVKAKPDALPTKPEVLPTVAEVIKGFLKDAEGRLKPGTVKGYRDFLLPFGKSKDGKLKVSALTAQMAEAYSSKPEWSSSTRHGFLSVLSIAMRWASSPLKLKKPTMESRGDKAIISPETHAKLMHHAPEYFKPFLSLLHLTGARPSEVAAFSAENFDEGKGIVVLKEHKTKHKTGKPRIVFLPAEAVAIMMTLKAKRESGALCRNRYGWAYTKDAIVRMMDRLSKRAGVKAITPA